jgi:hypothetical protein
MTWGEASQMLTAVAVVSTAILSWRNGRKIEAVHTSTNGKMDELLKVTGASEKAKGVIEGQQQERDSRPHTGE